MLFMMERFKDNDTVPVYRRFRDKGRVAMMHRCVSVICFSACGRRLTWTTTS